MRNTRSLHAVAAMLVLLALMPAAAPAAAPDGRAKAVAVDDFGYLDTSDEPTDQTGAHQARLQAFMTALRGDIGADKRFQLVASACAPPCANDGPAFAERLRSASRDGAAILIVGKIQKTSTLVQWARAAAIDTTSNRVMFEKLFTFRGDNDEAWRRAEGFVSDELRAALADGPATATPVAAPASVKLAVFPFELEDTSASAESTGETASDASGLADTTDAIRQLLAQSGRYRLVDPGAAGGDPAKAGRLRECGGCDAQIALGLGADQSLLGVIRRVSRTEYVIGFKLRDSRSGAVLAAADSGLRMGANYSWSRGAARLVRDRLLESDSRN
jgi:hypothetical protein